MCLIPERPLGFLNVFLGLTVYSVGTFSRSNSEI
jgi:hypothetical protein